MKNDTTLSEEKNAGPNLSEEMNGGPVMKEKLWTAPYITLISLGTFISISFYMVMPLLTKYAIQRGVPISVAGVIVGMFSITALFARPFAGIISDSLNKKYVFISATALIGLSLIGYSFSSGIASLIVFRIIHALAFSVNGTVNLALVARIVPRKRIGEGIGYFGLGHIIATAVGPTIGLYIGERYGLSYTFLLAGVIMISVSAMMTMLLPYSEKREEREKAGNRKRSFRITDLIAVKLLPFAFFGSVFSMYNGVIGSYLVLLGDERGIGNISLYFTFNAVTLAFVRLMTGKIYDRFGISAILFPAFALAGTAALFVGYAQSLPLILTAAVIIAFAQGSAQPTIQAECIRLLPENKSGIATSTYYIGADIGQGFGPMLAGVIASTWNYKVMFTVCSCVFIVSLLLYWVRVRFFSGRILSETV